MTLLGITFAVIAARTPVTLARATTGPLAAIAGTTVFCAAVLALIGLLLLLFVFLRRPGKRLRASLSYAIGVCLFVAVFLATDRRVTRPLPERHSAAQVGLLPQNPRSVPRNSSKNLFLLPSDSCSPALRSSHW
ncbi:hypothetical membrane spanning protein [Cupriavidus necator H16]|uniref:Hypothetical membrane spanning protein n=1 Tax=Cupriavidus necator (strain ATCC 17699 / DSM 428 / KCTC 22496 / NCIMB 10442 / H16 / Stanier 337) TaxID=381666 RepID=Q0K6T8_CUPNH|nr:hypothetical membrane spanning protein [Cupriavidus necator H16]